MNSNKSIFINNKALAAKTAVLVVFVLFAVYLFLKGSSNKASLSDSSKADKSENEYLYSEKVSDFDASSSFIKKLWN